MTKTYIIIDKNTNKEILADDCYFYVLDTMKTMNNVKMYETNATRSYKIIKGEMF